MSPQLLYVYIDAMMKEVKMRMGVRCMEKGRGWKLPNLLHANDLLLSG